VTPQRILLALLISAAAIMATGPFTHARASALGSAVSAPDMLLSSAGYGSAPAIPADVRLPLTGQARTLNWFPFNSCFSFFSCRTFSFSGCFNFFSFGCRTFNTPFFNFPFFPFFNRFNFNFGSNNCIQIMRMPGGSTITIRVC
jgi:hypothetical protein